MLELYKIEVDKIYCTVNPVVQRSALSSTWTKMRIKA